MSEQQIVHVIDDDRGFRASLSNLLQSMGFHVATHEGPDSFMECGHCTTAGCLLLDIKFPGFNGLDFQEAHRVGANPIPVIIMTGQPDVPSSIRGLKAGAVDFLIKPIEDEILFDAVTTAFRQDREKRAGNFALATARARYTTLTKRERGVMELVTAGLMNKQVAGELALSEITVKVHRGSMMRKMGLRTLADLVRMHEHL